jgi:valyl-tRNA synthetase
MIKPGSGETMSRAAYEQAIGFYETLVSLLHPFMPYITEELWHQLRPSRGEADCVTVAPYPEAGPYDEAHLAECEKALQLIVKLRGLRAQFNLSPKEPLQVHLRPSGEGGIYERFAGLISKLAGVESVQMTARKPAGASMILIKQDEAFVPLADKIDVAAEIAKVEQELQRTQNFLAGVEKKLANERFLQNAKPELVERERQKQADARARIAALEENLADLKRIEAG